MTYYQRIAIEQIKANGFWPGSNNIAFVEDRLRAQELVNTELLIQEDWNYPKDWDIMENYFEQREANEAVTSTN